MLVINNCTIQQIFIFKILAACPGLVCIMYKISKDTTSTSKRIKYAHLCVNQLLQNCFGKTCILLHALSFLVQGHTADRGRGSYLYSAACTFLSGSGAHYRQTKLTRKQYVILLAVCQYDSLIDLLNTVYFYCFLYKRQY